MSKKEVLSLTEEDAQSHHISENIEISEWLDWMRAEFPAAGLDLPSEETCVLFALRALSLTQRAGSLCWHLPSHLRTQLIQASILHQCWNRQRKLRKGARIHIQQTGKVCAYQASHFRGRWNGDHLADATDGHRYLIKFPRSDAETALATEIICIEFARLMGLKVPNACLVLATRDLARNVGVVECGWPRYVAQDNMFPCLGLHLAGVATPCDEGDKKDYSKNNLTSLVGALVFDIIVLNLIHERPFFRRNRGHREPVFLYRSHCMMDSHWSRFVKASYKEQVTMPSPIAHDITSMEQLEFWMKRARNVDFNRLWELGFSLPEAWYGGHRILLTGVLRKLESRVGNVRESIHYLAQQGYFPNLAAENGNVRSGVAGI